MPDGPEPGLAEAVLGGARTLTRPQVIAAAGIDPEEGERLWRALGFPEPADDDVLFTDRDVEAVRVMQQLGDAGLLPPRVREAVARAVAQDMSRLAEWQVGMLRTVLAGPAGERSPPTSPRRSSRSSAGCRTTCGAAISPPRWSGRRPAPPTATPVRSPSASPTWSASPARRADAAPPSSTTCSNASPPGPPG
ncbi:hypothetical protein ACFQV8_18095 [Pseudonocardia benzenivorans]